MIRTILIILLSMAPALSAYAENWCEELIQYLNSVQAVDKTFSVKRNPQTHKVEQGTYDYRFESKSLYSTVSQTLRSHASEADYFSENGNRVIVMRMVIDGQQWDCKLQDSRKQKRFLVYINQGGSAAPEPMRQAAPSRPHHSSSGSSVRHETAQQTQADKTAIDQNNQAIKKAEADRNKRLSF